LLALSLVIVPLFVTWMILRGTGVFTRLLSRLSTQKPLEQSAEALELAADVLEFKAQIQETREIYVEYVRLRSQLSEQTADTKDEWQNQLWGLERTHQQTAASLERWRATLAREGADVSELKLPTYEEAEQVMYMEDAELEVEEVLRR
jgi:hypothetical protein